MEDLALGRVRDLNRVHARDLEVAVKAEAHQLTHLLVVIVIDHVVDLTHVQIQGLARDHALGRVHDRCQNKPIGYWHIG